MPDPADPLIHIGIGFPARRKSVCSLNVKAEVPYDSPRVDWVAVTVLQFTPGGSGQMSVYVMVGFQKMSSRKIWLTESTLK